MPPKRSPAASDVLMAAVEEFCCCSKYALASCSRGEVQVNHAVSQEWYNVVCYIVFFVLLLLLCCCVAVVTHVILFFQIVGMCYIVVICEIILC